MTVEERDDMISNQFILDCQKEFRESMAKLYLQSFEDTEEAHMDADGVMCEMLSRLGFEAGVELFMQMPKWYA